MMKSLFKGLDNQLSEAKCTNVEAITYDENFVVFLDLMEVEIQPAKTKVITSDPAIFNNEAKTLRDFQQFVHENITSNKKISIGKITRDNFENELKDKHESTLLAKYSLNPDHFICY